MHLSVLLSDNPINDHYQVNFPRVKQHSSNLSFHLVCARPRFNILLIFSAENQSYIYRECSLESFPMSSLFNTSKFQQDYVCWRHQTMSSTVGLASTTKSANSGEGPPPSLVQTTAKTATANRVNHSVKHSSFGLFRWNIENVNVVYFTFFIVL